MPPLTRRRLKEIAALTKRKERDRRGELVVEGLRSVESAVAAGGVLVDLLVTEAALDDPRVEAVAERAAVAATPIAARDLARLSDVQTHQGVLAVARLPEVPLETLQTLPSVLALDGVQDPGNVGTLIRTAAWFGVGGVVAGPGTADLYHPKVIRATMGGIWDVRPARTADLAETLAAFRAAGRRLYGADLDGAPVAAWQPAAPAVLVLGSEAHGLQPEVAALLDGTVTIAPGAARQATESLNVGIAGGILLYAWSRSGRL